MDPVQQWSDFLQFLISCVSMSVGLGNLWRFPFIVYENGGGAFLFSYIIIQFVFGIPLYFLELGLGQFSSKASLKMFHSLAPAFTGVGALQVFATVCACSYYSPILAVMGYYFVKSFTAALPWGICFSQYEDICLASSNSTVLKNMTSSTELFFTKYLFNEPENLDYGIGIPDWRLALGLFLTWFGTFFVLTKGMRTSGKTPYFFGLYPYFTLFIMLGVSISQKGSANGLSYFFRFHWNQLLDARVSCNFFLVKISTFWFF
ncbi:hypothetical protein ILUMI_04379 [Ignelater luminosus]|uniref:Transporter n=1 Tax=Ignelater luminosus TaxID=2038154 RepID=A0A8K0DEG4_IGNLU|nr:hypothetical protein ILUMI_04379 [Ignelater luminosus]